MMMSLNKLFTKRVTWSELENTKSSRVRLCTPPQARALRQDRASYFLVQTEYPD